MSPQDRKYFRLRFIRVMALICLLISPTQASSRPKGCAAVVSAWMATDYVYTLVHDSKFIGNLAECIKEIMEGAKFIGKLKPIIEQLPELAEKALRIPFAKEGGGLVLLSAYVFYRSFELYNRALDLEEDYKMYRDEFEALKEEMKPYKDFIVKELIPQCKKGNASNLLKVTDKLLQMMAHQLTVMRELVQAIHRGSKNTKSDNRWSVFYTGVAVAACVCSVAVGNDLVILVTFGAGIGTIAFNAVSIVKSRYTLTKLDTLGKDVNAMRKETKKYRAQLDVAKMRGELYI